MIKEFEGGVRVNSKIRTLPIKDRIVPKLIVGNIYYASFGLNCAYPCVLKEIINEYSQAEIKVKFMIKPQYVNRRGYLGPKVQIYAKSYILYTYEIGATPEDAIRNSR